MCFSPVISAMICCQVQISVLWSLDFIYCMYEFILLTHNVCVLAEKSELGSMHCAAVVVFSSVYIGVCLPKVKWKIMKWEVCTSLQLLLQWYVVKWRSVFCSVSDLLIPFPVCMNLFCLCIRFVLWQKNQSLSQCTVLLL